LHEFKSCTEEGKYKLMIKPPENDDEHEFQTAKDQLLSIVNSEYQKSAEFHVLTKSKKAFQNNQEIWLAAYNILKAGNVKAGSLFNLNECREVLTNMAKLDRLPSENTPQTLVLLRCAWTLVDLLHDRAWFYKITAKCFYLVYLSLGAAIVVMMVLGAIYPAEVTENYQQKVLLVLTLLGSLAAGWTTFMNPTSKWMLLQSGALSLETEIWKFRARIGPEYTGAAASISVLGRHEAERVAERNFQITMNAIRDKCFKVHL